MSIDIVVGELHVYYETLGSIYLHFNDKHYKIIFVCSILLGLELI